MKELIVRYNNPQQPENIRIRIEGIASSMVQLPVVNNWHESKEFVIFR